MTKKITLIAVGAVLGVVLAVAGDSFARKQLGRSLAEDLTRAGMPYAGDTATGTHFTLSITAASAAVASAMTKADAYEIGCNVDTICEFGASAPTADANSHYYVPAGGYRSFTVGTPGGTDNDWIACIAQDGASSGSCYITHMD